MATLGLFNLLALVSRIRKKPWERTVTAMACSMLLAAFCASGVMPEVNVYTAYGYLCAAVPENGDVVTLHVRRPENMDVYLGRDVVDFAKDIDAFLASDYVEDTADSPALGTFTLVVKESKVNSDERLKAFVGGCSVSRVGQWCVAVKSR